VTIKPLATLHELAAGQGGLVARSHARAAGVSDDQIKRLVAAGVVELAQRGVLRLAASPPTWEQKLRALLLRSGDHAVASHRAAARVFALEGSEDWPVELTVPTGCRVRGLDVRVRESTDLASGDVSRRRGIRVTTPTRTLVDLGASVSPATLEVALDDALRRRLTSVPMLRQSVQRLARRGRSGPASLRTLLDERDELDGLTDTGFETLVRRILRSAGLPSPRAQHVVRDERGSFVMRLDLAYPEVLVGIEADSERWHTDRRRFQDDRTKRAIAESLGWTVLAFTHRHVVRQQPFVAETVGRTLANHGVVLPTRWGG
jgi:very-short-patch-repair endonuclease